MSLTRKQFDVLEKMASENDALSQRDLEKLTGHSLGTINRVIKELTDLGFVSNGSITDAGLNALEPYRAKRAVFIAAGFGSRLVPITFNTPKPLVRVKGTRIIDHLIDACLEAGIEEIYIVRGYLAEQFDQLLYKYPTVKFLENPVYNEANNISSSLIAKELLSNAYVFEADLLLSNPKIITKYHYTSDFLAIKKDRTDDWCFEVKDKIITEEKVGGEDCWQMSVSATGTKRTARSLQQTFLMFIPHPAVRKDTGNRCLSFTKRRIMLLRSASVLKTISSRSTLSRNSSRSIPLTMFNGGLIYGTGKKKCIA